MWHFVPPQGIYSIYCTRDLTLERLLAATNAANETCLTGYTILFTVQGISDLIKHHQCRTESPLALAIVFSNQGIAAQSHLWLKLCCPHPDSSFSFVVSFWMFCPMPLPISWRIRDMSLVALLWLLGTVVAYCKVVSLIVCALSAGSNPVILWNPPSADVTVLWVVLYAPYLVVMK